MFDKSLLKQLYVPSPSSHKWMNGKLMIIFAKEGDRYPFQFQAGKAQKICDALEVHGLRKVIEALYKVAGREIPHDIRGELIAS